MATKDPMNDKAFSSDEICTIIETCAKVGVGRMKLPGIEISFRENFLYSPQQNYLSGPTENVDPQYGLNEGPASPVSEHNFRTQSAPQKPKIDTDLLDDMRRSQLMMDDPAAFEQEIIAAHMRSPDDTAEDRRTQ